MTLDTFPTLLHTVFTDDILPNAADMSLKASKGRLGSNRSAHEVLERARDVADRKEIAARFQRHFNKLAAILNRHPYLVTVGKKISLAYHLNGHHEQTFKTRRTKEESSSLRRYHFHHDKDTFLKGHVCVRLSSHGQVNIYGMHTIQNALIGIVHLLDGLHAIPVEKDVAHSFYDVTGSISVGPNPSSPGAAYVPRPNITFKHVRVFAPNRDVAVALGFLLGEDASLVPHFLHHRDNLETRFVVTKTCSITRPLF